MYRTFDLREIDMQILIARDVEEEIMRVVLWVQNNGALKMDNSNSDQNKVNEINDIKLYLYSGCSCRSQHPHCSLHSYVTTVWGKSDA